MKRLDMLWVILGSIFFAIFNALFFLTEMIKGEPFPTWATYAFIVIAFGIFVATPFMIKKYPIKRKIFKLLPTEFAGVYFAIQLIFGLVFIISGLENYIPALLIQLALLAIFAVIFVIHLIISEKDLDKTTRDKEKGDNVNNDSSTEDSQNEVTESK